MLIFSGKGINFCRSSLPSSGGRADARVILGIRRVGWVLIKVA